ncbi:hypothetical protein Tco_0783705 [Tanacetum coccineum]
METDASGSGLGAVLLQEGHPITFLSNAVSTKHHLILKYLLDQRMSTPTQLKWLPKLIVFDYEIQYKKEVENVIVDALSRIQHPVELFSVISTSLTTEIYQKIVRSWSTDEKLKEVIQQLQVGKTVKGSYT